MFSNQSIDNCDTENTTFRMIVKYQQLKFNPHTLLVQAS
jgi:hypothetical protein